MEAESLISDGLQPQLYSFCELTISQQSDSNSRGVVFHDNFKIEGKKWVQLEGKRVYPIVYRGWLSLPLLSCT